MKIVIYPSFGGTYIPPFLEEQLTSDNWLHRRVELANIIKKLEPTHDEITQEVYSAYVDNETHELNFFDYIKDRKNPNVIYVESLKEEYVYKMEIVDVDINKIWKITEYDGGEWIEYFQEPKIIDKNLNYAEW